MVAGLPGAGRLGQGFHGHHLANAVQGVLHQHEVFTLKHDTRKHQREHRGHDDVVDKIEQKRVCGGLGGGPKRIAHEHGKHAIADRCVENHRRAHRARVADDPATVVVDGLFEPLEREHRLPERLHHRDAAYILHSLAAHLLLRIEILLLEVVVSRVHHIAHDAEGTDDWQHSRQAQLPVHCQ